MTITNFSDIIIMSIGQAMSTLYELRLIFTQGDKKEYSTEEIVELLDKIATAKDQK